MIVNNKLVGTSSKKNEIFGEFKSGGFSSKINYVTHLRDLNNIRLNNNQSKLLVYFLYLMKIIKKPIKFLKAYLDYKIYKFFYFFLKYLKSLCILSLLERTGLFVFHFIFKSLSLNGIPHSYLTSL